MGHHTHSRQALLLGSKSSLLYIQPGSIWNSVKHGLPGPDLNQSECTYTVQQWVDLQVNLCTQCLH